MKSLIKPINILLLWLICVSTGYASDVPTLVGVIYSSDNSYYRETFQRFDEELIRLGYGPEKIKLFVQKPHADIFSWANSARRAEAAGSKALVTFGTPATRVSLQEVQKLPIVFSASFSPLEVALETLQDVSANDLRDTSGIYSQVPVATLIKLYAEILDYTGITAVFHENDLDAPYIVKQLEQASSVYGLNLSVLTLSNKSFEKGLNRFRNNSGGYFISQGTFDQGQYTRLVTKFEEQSVPFVSCGSGFVAQALVSLEAEAEEQGTLAARKLVEILSGERSEDGEVFVMPHKVNLTINLQVAKSLGVKVPFQALASATRIVPHSEN